ncbi:MAG: HDIG domain-containing protein [Candidatus Desulfofervidaceae bacterium]|nr:HDIG domain-containing protein [Candidatus Desulfofervidaceae bacterium]
MSKQNRKKPNFSIKTFFHKLGFLWGWTEHTTTFHLVVILFSSLFIALVFYPNLVISPKHYQLGDIAESDIKAKRDFLVEDVATTESYRQEAREKVAPVYNFEEQVWLDIKNRIKNAFAQMCKFMEENKLKKLAASAVQTVEKQAPSVEILSDKEMQQQFESLLGIKLTAKEFQVLKNEEFSPQVEELLYQLLEPIFIRGIVQDKSTFPTFRYGITLVFRNPHREQRVFNPEKFLSLEEAKREIRGQRYSLYGKVKRETAKVIIKMAEGLLRPNIIYDVKETQLRRAKAAEEVKPVFYQVKKGEMIVREGERINKTQLLKLEAQEETTSYKQYLFLFAGVSGFIFILLWANKLVCQWLRPNFLESKSDFSFWISNILFFFILTRLGLEIGNLFLQSFSFFSNHAFVYPLPVASTTMLIALFTDFPISLLTGVLMAALAGFMVKSPAFFIYFLVGGLWTALELKSCRHRSKLIKVGLELGLIQCALALCIIPIEPTNGLGQNVINLGLAILGGLGSSIIVLGLTPIVEIIFGYTSDIRLLELANLDQPILKELMVKAPGTYHHSVIVSQLVEAAAEEIGANPLLAKVAAYYHDIGKIKKPLYFIENQIGTENRHDRLNPSMSALIIISHVKDGVELAKQYRLGNRIIDIIRQHHGTRLVAYFYHKAKENDPNVKEEDFRYPGPKPQTKEAGLVMLADAVEAASRSLVDPSPARIQNTVQKVISDIFLDGQLDECELTLKDMHKIAEMFSKVLTGIFHPRIEYPELPRKGDNKSNGRVDRSTSDKSSQNREASEEDKTPFRHLGIVKS